MAESDYSSPKRPLHTNLLGLVRDRESHAEVAFVDLILQSSLLELKRKVKKILKE